MIDRRLAIFSGVSARVTDRVRPQLASAAIESAFVRFDGIATDGYFDDLIARSLEVARRLIAPGNVRLSVFLISALETNEDRTREKAAFFPAVRRLTVSRAFRNDFNRANEFARIIATAFLSAGHKAFVKSLDKNSPLLLPLRNTPCRPMQGNFNEIYERTTEQISQVVSRHIVNPRGSRGHRVKDLMFMPAVNSGIHPIRRCSDSVDCDLKALMRFGVAVPERLEFDVSCENGLQGKHFALCDGQSMKINKGVSHLNMRINDDFQEGT